MSSYSYLDRDPQSVFAASSSSAAASLSSTITCSRISPTITATTATTTTSPPAQDSIISSSNSKKKNPVIQLGQYLVDSFVRAKDGTVQLYTNHRRCNEIRDKQRQYRSSLKGVLLSTKGTTKSSSSSTVNLHQPPHVGITYDEFLFLQQGKEDRGKLANIVFMMIFAPNFVPYAFMVFPDMLPSPFVQKQSSTISYQTEEGYTKKLLIPFLEKDPKSTTTAAATSSGIHIYKYHDALSRQKTHVVLSTLLELEKNAFTPSFFANLNPFGKNKMTKQMELLDDMNDQLALFLSNRSTFHGDSSSSPSSSSSTSTPFKQSWISTVSSSKSSSSKRIPSSSFTNHNNHVTKDARSHDATTTHGNDGISGPYYTVMKALHHKLYSKDIPHDKNEAQLVILPKCIVQGLDQLLSLSFTTPVGMSGKSSTTSSSSTSSSNTFITSLLPKFILRGKVLNYMKQIEEADEFLIDSKTNLNTLHRDVLQSTCQKRLIGGPDRTEQELRESLFTWLDCTVVVPRKRISTYHKKHSSEVVVASTASKEKSPTRRNTLYFNGNLARAALLCYNALEGARDSRNASYLPRLLFTGSI